MGYQGRRKSRPIDDLYGPNVGGFRYKKFRPSTLTSTILYFVAKSGPRFLSFENLYKSVRAEFTHTVTKRQIQVGLQQLKRGKFIAFPGKGRYVITDSGKQRLKKVELDRINVIHPQTWDKMWRLLTFDIVEEKAQMRDYFRKRLKEIGFYHFQQSVFIFPFPCQKEIDELSTALGVVNGVHLITAQRFEGDDALIKIFNLKI